MHLESLLPRQAVAGHPSLTGEEAILYILASCHFIQGTLLDMALSRVAIEGEWA